MSLADQINALPEFPSAADPISDGMFYRRMSAAYSQRLALARESIQWMLDNCDDSPEYNFGQDEADAIRALLSALQGPK